MSRQQLTQSAIYEGGAFRELDSKLQKITISTAAEPKSSDQLGQLLRGENMPVKQHISKTFEQHNLGLGNGVYQRRILESLYFSEVHARQEEIIDAHKETFQWVFEQAESRPRPWDSFAEWLESGSRTYWISGKAGSGKSTLMNYICQHPRTQQCLKSWSAGRAIVTPKFFFWSPGTSMQKSSQGLLRSLVYQILSENPDSIHAIMNLHEPSRDAFAPVPAWTEVRLIKTLLGLVQHLANRLCICFFIDGLDEYSGDQNALLDLIEQLAEYPNVKCCLSSRPYRAFTDAFSSRTMLKLHDLTEPDIRAYVSDKFKALPRVHPSVTFNTSRVSRLENEIVKKAEGVFLWVDLAVRDQIEGVGNGDSIDLLEKRLWLLPNEIEDLYARMLDRIETIYEKEVATYLRVAVDLESATLLDMVLAIQGQETSHSRSSTKPHLSEMLQDSEFTRRRINTICAGLLEVYDPKETIPEQGQDRFCGYCTAHPTVIFCHETAFEYLLSNKKGRQFLEQSAPFNLKSVNKYVLQHRLRLEKLRVLGIPASVDHQGCFSSMIVDTMSLAGRVEKDIEMADVSLMDNFDNIVATLDRNHLQHPPDRHWSIRWGDLLRSPHDYLSLAAYHSGFLYVQHVLNNRRDPIDRETASHLLYHTIFCRSPSRGLVSPSLVCESQLKLVILLLRRGADPNIADLDTTIWKEFLSQMFLRRLRFKDLFLEDHAKPLWIKCVKQFLLQGADVLENIASYFYDFEIEGFPSSPKWRYTGSKTLSPLTVIQLCLGSEPEYLDMEKTCLARGGSFHAAYHEFQFSSFVEPQTFAVYRLSERQSERICRDFQEYMQAPFALAREAHWEFKQRLDRLQRELHDNHQMEVF